jgi:FkbM family methyltransferase
MISEWPKRIIRTVVPRGARNWLRSPAKSVEWLSDSLRFSLGETKQLTLLSGWSVVCHPRVYKTFLGSQVNDPEQCAEFRNFVRYCDSSMRLFDIGASFGAFSLAAAHFGGTSVAVDASPIASRFLRLQTQLNGYENSIRVVQACVSDSAGEREMLSSGVFSDGYYKMTKQKSSKELMKTPSVTIDQLADQFGPPTHIKIDVEGYEGTVLRGAEKTLARLAPLLFLELHSELIRSEGSDPNYVLDYLAEMKYEMFSIELTKFDRLVTSQIPICRLVGKPCV